VDRALRDEARALLADAGETLAEWIEEGVDAWERGRVPAVGAAPAPAGAPAFRLTADRARDRLGEEREREPRPRAADPPAPGAPQGPRPTLAAVREVLGDCRRCELCQGRSTIVFGDGNPDADLMFIGEGPGQEEDRRGLPFVGRAGELLTQMIEKGLEIPRGSVYICNIVKCRPPNNRTPLPPEVNACRPFLDGQIDAVRPKVIVALGRPAASLLLGRDVPITRVRGTWHEYRGIPLMPTLHPAFVLRQYTPENRRNVWEDLKAALARSRQS
jgi:DNA polymerase